jgi:hypothetical protein
MTVAEADEAMAHEAIASAPINFSMAFILHLGPGAS